MVEEVIQLLSLEQLELKKGKDRWKWQILITRNFKNSFLINVIVFSQNNNYHFCLLMNNLSNVGILLKQLENYFQYYKSMRKE